jgi:transposase
VLEPDCDQTKALRALTRAREDLVGTRTGVMNQLRCELERFWPGPLRLFSHMDAEILLAFLERYPSPADARGLGVARMQAFLVRERYSGGQHPTALMAKLRSAPSGRVGDLELAARRQIVLSFVSMIRTLNAQIKDLERGIRTQVRAHPDGPIFLSLFKSPNSVITAAELLAEIGDCRQRYPTRDSLAADAGHAAVAIESGKRKTAGFRWGCNKRLRIALCRLADSSRHWHPWAAALYAQARQRGHEHPRAIRTVGRAWCRVVWQCWRNHTPYDPTKHRSLQRHITVTIPTPSGHLVDHAATERMASPGLWRPDLSPVPVSG